MQASYLGDAIIETIYFGGGTPSLLTGEEVSLLLATLRTQFICASEMEVTLEANPDDLHADKLQALRTAGINRLSIGVQSFHDDILHTLNRAHNRQEALVCITAAQQVGFTQLSIDLMYALPGLSLAQWQEDLRLATQLAPVHISAYCLTIEPRTVFGHRKAQRQLEPIADEVVATQFDMLVDTLVDAGYEQYEVANFCLPPHYAKHNTHYWKRIPYLGLGPSAHSYDGVSRQWNVRSNKAYIEAMGQGKLPAQREVLTKKELINEHVMLGLRTKWGCDMDWLKDVHGYDLLRVHKASINKWQQEGLLIIRGATLLLTRKGRLVADAIAQGLLVVD